MLETIVTVRDVLLNGRKNILKGLGELGWEQIDNACTAIKNGMELDDVMQANLDGPIRLKKDDPL